MAGSSQTLSYFSWRAESTGSDIITYCVKIYGSLSLFFRSWTWGFFVFFLILPLFQGKQGGRDHLRLLHLFLTAKSLVSYTEWLTKVSESFMVYIDSNLDLPFPCLIVKSHHHTSLYHSRYSEMKENDWTWAWGCLDASCIMPWPG